jgi:ABC-type proline/glycine betaine transport system ATPase subunit
MLRFEGVRKALGGREVIRGIDLEVEAGRTTVLIGPSGCGKSTLLRLLLGLLVPDSGGVRFGGQPVDDTTVRGIRHRTGYVVQDGGLFPHLTARANVTLMGGQLGWDRQRISTRLDELRELTKFPVDGLDRFPRQLSGGQQQRVALMRALLLDPDVLLLDEPLAALDPMIRFDLQTDLRSIFRQLGKTTVLVTHDLAEAAYFADRVVLLRDGRIAQQGAIRELLEQPSEARPVRLCGPILGTALLLASATTEADAATIVIGSKKFTESVILGEIARQTALLHGAEAEHRQEIGGTRILFKALQQGQIDIYPEYTGTIVREIFAGEGLEGETGIRAALAVRGIRMTAPLGFNNTYAIGVRPQTADDLGLISVSDLRAHPSLRFGFTNEFMDRGDGWPGLRDRYRLPQTDVAGLDHDLALRALNDGSIDLTDLYSTDAEIAYYGFRVLEDDLGYFPRYDAVFLYRADLERRAPAIVAALAALAGTIAEPRMVEMNRSVKIDRGGVSRRDVRDRGRRPGRGDVCPAATEIARGAPVPRRRVAGDGDRRVGADGHRRRPAAAGGAGDPGRCCSCRCRGRGPTPART